MRSEYIWGLFFVLMLALGCESVTSRYAVGQRPAVIISEEWNGEWSPDCSGEEVLRIEVKDKDKGIIRVQQIKSDTGNLEELDCYLYTAGDWMFGNAAYKSELYPFRIRNVEGSRIFVWFPDFNKFKALVEKGLLPGEVHEGEVSLDLLKPEHLELITSEKEGVLFRWGEPEVLIRQGKGPVLSN